ncbi:MAG: phosphoglycerate kinase, partial [Bacteroidales bacterium]|nr:phosphoglycerate kinase [Bacteroidales bacterium]
RLAKEKGVEIVIPEDCIAADRFDNEAERMEVDSSSIPDGWMGLDIGPFTIGTFRDILMESRTILWNGPMGVFEMENFAHGTEEIALAVADATDEGAFSLIGGGDSVAAVNKYELADRVGYVSTGGGAMLEYIEGKELPGVTAIKKP